MPNSSTHELRQPLVVPGGIDCHAADLTATISAEMPLKIAQWRLGEFDQWIPIDGDPNLPIGRLVAENSTGPLRLGYGAWRDLLLGCQFRASSGELITAGGRTIKNVAGYDLTKFMVGQRGIFGRIVTITTRAYRRPAMALLAEFEPSDQLMGRWIPTPLKPRWAALTRNRLFCGWLDDDQAIDSIAQSAIAQKPLAIAKRPLSEDIAHRAELWQTDGDSFRASVPPSNILAFTQAAEITHWTADAAFGIVLGNMAGVDEARLQLAASSVGGSVTIFRENQPPLWQGSPGELSILEKLMAAFAR